VQPPAAEPLVLAPPREQRHRSSLLMLETTAQHRPPSLHSGPMVTAPANSRASRTAVWVLGARSCQVHWATSPRLACWVGGMTLAIAVSGSQEQHPDQQLGHWGCPWVFPRWVGAMHPLALRTRVGVSRHSHCGSVLGEPGFPSWVARVAPFGEWVGASPMDRPRFLGLDRAPRLTAPQADRRAVDSPSVACSRASAGATSRSD
jgi:hypothetical protein